MRGKDTRRPARPPASTRPSEPERPSGPAPPANPLMERAHGRVPEDPGTPRRPEAGGPPGPPEAHAAPRHSLRGPRRPRRTEARDTDLRETAGPEMRRRGPAARGHFRGRLTRCGESRP